MRRNRRGPSRFLNASMGVGIGFASAPRPWSIPSALPDAWWLDPVGAPLTLTYAGQPVVANPLFASGDASWTKGAGWSIAVGAASFAPGGAGALLYQGAVGIVGNRYGWDWKLNSGVVQPYNFGGSGTARAVAGWYSEERTATSTAIGFSSGVVPCEVGGVRNVANLSLASVAPRQGEGDIENITAGAQMWRDTATGGLRFDGVADFAQIDALASAWPLHKAQGFALSARLLLGTGSATIGVIYSTAADATGVGIRWAYDEVNQKITVAVANGTGAYECEASTANGSVTRNAEHTFTINWSEADGLTILVDAAAAVTQASGGAASAADATYAPLYGKDSAGNFFDGVILELLVNKTAVDATTLANMHEYMVAA